MADTTSTTMTITGTAVSCVQCLALITNGLTSFDDIYEVTADKQTDTLFISYDQGAVDEDEIRARLRSLGFAGPELYCIC